MAQKQTFIKIYIYSIPWAVKISSENLYFLGHPNEDVIPSHPSEWWHGFSKVCPVGVAQGTSQGKTMPSRAWVGGVTFSCLAWRVSHLVWFY